jgi:hypothetical protein
MARLMSFVFVACLLAIATPTGAPAAGPDWPKSLTLGTASPAGCISFMERSSRKF